MANFTVNSSLSNPPAHSRSPRSIQCSSASLSIQSDSTGVVYQDSNGILLTASRTGPKAGVDVAFSAPPQKVCFSMNNVQISEGSTGTGNSNLSLATGGCKLTISGNTIQNTVQCHVAGSVKSLSLPLRAPLDVCFERSGVNSQLTIDGQSFFGGIPCKLGTDASVTTNYGRGASFASAVVSDITGCTLVKDPIDLSNTGLNSEQAAQVLSMLSTGNGIPNEGFLVTFAGMNSTAPLGIAPGLYCLPPASSPEFQLLNSVFQQVVGVFAQQSGAKISFATGALSPRDAARTMFVGFPGQFPSENILGTYTNTAGLIQLRFPSEMTKESFTSLIKHELTHRFSKIHSPQPESNFNAYANCGNFSETSLMDRVLLTEGAKLDPCMVMSSDGDCLYFDRGLNVNQTCLATPPSAYQFAAEDSFCKPAPTNRLNFQDLVLPTLWVSIPSPMVEGFLRGITNHDPKYDTKITIVSDGTLILTSFVAAMNNPMLALPTVGIVSVGHALRTENVQTFLENKLGKINKERANKIVGAPPAKILLALMCTMVNHLITGDSETATVLGVWCLATVASLVIFLLSQFIGEKIHEHRENPNHGRAILIHPRLNARVMPGVVTESRI